MALLALIIALLIEQYLHKDTKELNQKVSHRRWFTQYQTKMDAWFGEQTWYPKWIGQAVVLFAPVLIVYWIFAWYQHDWWFHGGLLGSLFMLALAVGVLVLCMGPESPRKSLKAYYKARAEHQDDEAKLAAIPFIGESAAEETSTIEELDQLVSKMIFRKAQCRYFAVVIWFTLLGPAGALLYRLTSWYLESNPSEGFVYKLNLVLEWIPGRVSALAYLLAGDMGAGVKQVKGSFLDFDVEGLSYVEQAGFASLGFYEEDDARGPSRWALKLSERAGVIIFAFSAFFSLLGLGLY